MLRRWVHECIARAEALQEEKSHQGKPQEDGLAGQVCLYLRMSSMLSFNQVASNAEISTLVLPPVIWDVV